MRLLRCALFVLVTLAACVPATPPAPSAGPTSAPVVTGVAVASPGLAPAATAAPPPATPTRAAPAPKTTIVDRTTGWPRRVQAVNGLVEIKAKPMRIHTLSVGYDEITFRLVDPGRIAAVARFSVDPRYSNVAELAKQVPTQVGRDAEEVIAARPDLVVASPFSNKDLVQRLVDAGVPVIITDLVQSPEAHAANIRLMAYLFGEEERGEALVRELEERLAAIDRIVQPKPAGARQRVLMLVAKNFTPGEGSTEDAVIRRAGGINVAAEAGIKGNKQISLETIPEMKPDVILLAEVDLAKPELAEPVTGHPALQEVPAIKNKRIVPVRQAYFNTLSHWNVRGIEDLAKILYPDDFR
ncbi:MAG: ABC transporter substrate-binding protein [Chloroflexi bacterium]|nr:ABC transporter substrate-binding protein [Chloroflexota bacterium]